MTSEHVPTYRRARRNAIGSVFQGQPEAQLSKPVADFLQGVAAEAGLGVLELVPEVQLEGVRPDFGVSVDGVACGWLELKAPGHTLAGERWTGREKRQWELLSALDSLLVANGEGVRLYQAGEQVGKEVPFPSPDEAEGWDEAPMVSLLRQFAEARPRPITRVSELSRRLAPLAAMLRDRLAAHLSAPTPPVAVARAFTAWKDGVHEGATKDQFCDDVAQVISYSLAIAALKGGADINRDNRVTLAEAKTALSDQNAVLSAAIGPVLGVTGFTDHVTSELGALERLASSVDSVRLARRKDSRGEPWLWFYEDFLATYDPAARKEAGVYYTPVDVVQCQVRLVESVLREVLGKPLGYGDSSVVTLDPATGSGTYPLAVVDRAEQTALEERGPAGPAQVATGLAERLLAFEVLPGPYAVAHLRIGRRLAEMADALLHPPHTRVYLTDTLEDPHGQAPQPTLWGDQEVLAAERAKAARVKSEHPVTAILGNPPYKRRTRASGGGWVVHADGQRSLFTDVIEDAQQAGVIFSAQASLYNDYVYFWRWALWKAFEQDPKRPAVVSFITAASWLRGPGFVGLRKLAQQHADEIWVLDLGGENRAANRSANVFAIETPVAVVTLYRKGKSASGPATVRYRREHHDRPADTLSAVSSVQAPLSDDAPGWEVLDLSFGAPFAPVTGDEVWDLLPALTDLFPWQQPGAMYNRAWPISPSPSALRSRWAELLAAPTSDERAERFVTASSGRSITTRVRGMRPLVELSADTAPEPIVRYAHRSFDRQWTFEDPRLAKTESPALWASRSDKQLYLSSMLTTELGAGPALTVATAPPDKHHFRGSFGGKDVIPLYRDTQGLAPNITAGLLDKLGEVLGLAVTAEDLAAYTYALLAHPGYEETFRAALGTPGPRVPVTADPDLFREAVETGQRLLWLQTYTERYRGTDRTSQLPRVTGLGWIKPVAAMPATPRGLAYDAASGTLTVGDGQVAGVSPAVWEFSVSGLQIVKRWLEVRTANGVGKSAVTTKTATPLDRIRPQEWEDEWNDELLELIRVLHWSIEGYQQQQDLLTRVLAAPLVRASDLPQPTGAQRKAPAV